MGGGSIFRKTPDIGLASYSIIPLRSRPLGVQYRKKLMKLKMFLMEGCFLLSNKFEKVTDEIPGAWEKLINEKDLTSTISGDCLW
jgi:hypothetical protein